jgi:hypothetical protein
MTLTLEQEYATFACALLDPKASAPMGLKVWRAGATSKRFAVYRNNVVVGLIDALVERFPVCVRLVGMDFFRAMGKLYVCASPPKTPILADYGKNFAEFTSGFEPTRELPYLADVARLEWAVGRAYHAADKASLSLEKARDIPADLLVDAVITLHPSLQLVSSRFPILSIWTTNMFDETVREVRFEESEDVLVVRPRLEVAVLPLPAGGYPFIAALSRGETVAGACATADTIELPACLELLLTSGALIAIEVRS